MPHPHAILLTDLAFGDCGKGTLIDYLAHLANAHTVVRFNGGPQAGHNVVTPDGRHHTFSQFGSATFLPHAKTLLSRFMLIEPYALLNEARHLEELGVPAPLARLHIDCQCPVITPAHQAANRLRELARGPNAHGTCGLGIGETMQDLLDHPDLTLRAQDLPNRQTVRKKLQAFVDLKRHQLRDAISSLRTQHSSLSTLQDPSWMDAAVDNYVHLARHTNLIDEPQTREILRAPGTLLFEAAQGVLLDEWFGFHPHTTWSTTTFANAQTLLNEANHEGPRTRLGVLRAYFTRHGPGPFVTDDPTLRPQVPEPHNDDRGWQGRFRVGPFDAVAARYALAVTGPVDALAITHLDRLPQLPPHICTAYDHHGERITDLNLRTPPDLHYQESLTHLLRECRPLYTPLPRDAFIQSIEQQLSTPVALTSQGPTANDKLTLKDLSPPLSAPSAAPR